MCIYIHSYYHNNTYQYGLLLTDLLFGSRSVQPKASAKSFAETLYYPAQPLTSAMARKSRGSSGRGRGSSSRSREEDVGLDSVVDAGESVQRRHPDFSMES